MCQNHWHELKNAVRQRGLSRLVTPAGCLSPEISEEILVLNAAQYAFDPLMASTPMISEQARAAFGGEPANGIHCPLCEVDENLGDGLSLEWIATDMDMILRVCRERRLVAANDS